MLLHQHDRLAVIIRHMTDHLGDRLAVEDLAAKACLSAPRFHAWFRQLTGQAPMEYFKQLRLSEAGRLLITGDRSLRDVAERTGFCNEFHFSRDFRRAYGKPPGRWRREYPPGLA